MLLLRTLERRHAYAIGVLGFALALTVYLFVVVFSRSASNVYCSKHNQSNSHDPGSFGADGNHLSSGNDCRSSFFHQANGSLPNQGQVVGLIGRSLLTVFSKSSQYR